jgi:NTE family protein
MWIHPGRVPLVVWIIVCSASFTDLAVAEESTLFPDSERQRPTVALVLGGGGAHAVAHLGILQELERQRVPIDMIIGTGLGAVVGGLYASGMPLSEIQEFLTGTNWPDIFDPDTQREDLSYRRKRDDEDFLIKYRVGIKDGQAQLPNALVPNEKLARLLQTTLAHTKGVDSFDQLPIPFRTVTMDLVTGEEVVLDSGSLDRAILASLSSPGTLPPVDIDGRPLITGSLLNNIPVDVAQNLGAGIILVADIGPYTRTADELNSVFNIVDQVSHLLQRQNTENSLAALRDSDIVFTPSISLADETDFSSIEQHIEQGAASVSMVANSLADIRIDEEQYARMASERQVKRTQVPIISAIELNNQSEVDDALILAQISQPLDAPLDKERLEADMRKIFGIGAFSTVDFNFRQEEENSVLELRAVESQAGNRFWRFGISLQDDLEGNSAYTGSASMTWTQLNSLGAEWRNVFRIGEQQQLSTEFYQPIDRKGRYFISVGGGYLEYNVNAFSDGEIVAQARVQQLSGQVSAGRVFGNSGEVRLGLLRGTGTSDSNIGSGIPSADFELGGALFSTAYDTFDNVYFPKRGAEASLGWVAQRESLGSSIDVDIVSGTLSSARTWGSHTVFAGLLVETQLDDVAGVQNLVSTGGLFRLSGFQRDEIGGRHTAVARTIYYRQLRSNPFRGLLDASLYVGASLELGNAWQDSSDVSFKNSLLAGSVFLGADTFIGPVYFAGGLAEGGHSAVYLFVGRPY